MTDRDRFAELAGAVACGDATPEQRREFATALAADPGSFGEWAKAQEVEETLRDRLRGEAAQKAALPPAVRAELEAIRLSALAAPGEAAGIRGVTSPPPERERSGARQRLFRRPRLLAWAAALVVLAGSVGYWLQSPPVSKISTEMILAPRGEIGVTRPVLVWAARPGERYDVWILPPEGSAAEAPALFIAKRVQPPVDFSALKPTVTVNEQSRPATRLEPQAEYRMLVCVADAGRAAGVAVPFRTAENATRSLPAPSVRAAEDLAASGRPAEALMVLVQLPEAERRQAPAQALEGELRRKLPKMTAPAAPH